MALKIGLTDIADVKIGNTDVLKIMLNGNTIWERSAYPDWFPAEPAPSPSIWYSYSYYAIFGVYRWGSTPSLYRYSAPTNRAVSFTADSSNQLSSSGFDRNDSKFEIAYLGNNGWYVNSGYWNANRTETNCNKIFLYDTNFTSITLNGIPKE